MTIARFYRFESKESYDELPMNATVLAVYTSENPVKTLGDGETERYSGFFVNTVEASIDPAYPNNEVFPETPLSRFSGF